VGLKINKDDGLLTFKAEKSYFLSGKLKYDVPYKVAIGVQNLLDPSDRADTSFTLLFYNTDIIPSKLKPTVTGSLYIDEGETVSSKFNVKQAASRSRTFFLRAMYLSKIFLWSQNVTMNLDGHPISSL